MSKSVYNIIWADDEIDAILDEFMLDDLCSHDIKVVVKARNGKDLENALATTMDVDAVIVDANFSDSSNAVESERDTSGLWKAIYQFHGKKELPVFLYTNRSEELLNETYKYSSDFKEVFKRHVNWFMKSESQEFEELVSEIKKAVDDNNDPAAIVKRRYRYELNAARVIDGASELIYDFLLRDYKGELRDIKEPFVSARRTIEKMFGLCERLCLIPPISDDTNGTAAYFIYDNYSPKGPNGQRETKYKSSVEIMPKPLAASLMYIVNLTQDGAHSKEHLSLKVDEYFNETKDTLLVKSVYYILIDIIKWFTVTCIQNRVPEENKSTLWEDAENNE